MATTTTTPTNSTNQQAQINGKHPSDEDDSPVIDVAKTKVLFDLLHNMNIEQLEGKDILPILPSLTKMLLNPAFVKRQQLLKLLFPMRRMNDVMQLMITKMESSGIRNAPPSTTFEYCDYTEKLCIVGAEYLKMYAQTRKANPYPPTNLMQSNLFDNPLYVDDVSYCLCVLLLRPSDNFAINIFDMSETLLHFRYGTAYIIRLLLNMPDTSLELCRHLISCGERQDEGSSVNEVSEQRAKILRLICAINPTTALTVQSFTLQMCKVPSLTIMIATDLLKSSLNNYKQLVDADLEDDSSNQMEVSCSEECDVALKNLKNVYDNVVSFISGILLGVDDELRIWFSQYTKLAQQKRLDQGHYTALMEFKSQLFSCLKCLLLSDGDSEGINCDISNSRQNLDLKTLNRKLIRAISTLRLFCALRGIGSIKLNPEESEILLRLVTGRPPISQTSNNYLITGVCTLLVCSSLTSSSKEEKRAGDWIHWIMGESGYSDEICSNGNPPTPDLLFLIARHFQANRNSQIADLICATLKMKLQIKGSVSKSKSLIMLVVFNAISVAEHTGGRIPKQIGDNMEYLPVHSAQHSSEHDSLSKYQVPIKDWIHGQVSKCLPKVSIHKNSTLYRHTSSSPKVISEELVKQFVDSLNNIETNPRTVIQLISSIMSLHKEELQPFIDPFLDNLSIIMHLQVSTNADYKKLVQIATKLWWKFNTAFPKELWVMTVNVLKRPQNLRIIQEIKPVEYSWDELALDPLIVLRCDNRVFRCVETLDIILHILSAFLAASRKCLFDQINETPGQKDSRGLEELRTTLILAQTSAAIQILLESCLPTEEEQGAIYNRDRGIELNEDEKVILEKFNASVNCICEHLHQVFIGDTNLAKLVHFQTYPSELLATTSDKIPSMHICLDFIPELLSQPDIAKQIFVIELTSHLCEKYATTKSLNVAKLCFNVAYTLLQLLPSERRAQFFIPVLPALMRICKVFPILKEDVDLILAQIEQITLAHMASTSSRLSLGSAKPFSGLGKISWIEAKKLMQTLDSHEALYLCIQKVIISQL